jgi:hypothetical protein
LEVVDIDVFKSRGEAVAYFIKKGIEASRELIKKTLEQTEKIRELRESIKKEFMEYEEEKE